MMTPEKIARINELAKKKKTANSTELAVSAYLAEIAALAI